VCNICWREDRQSSFHFPLRNFIRRIVFLLALFSPLLFSSCEKQKDTPLDPNYASPYLAPVALSRQVLDISNDTTGSVQKIDSSTYRITILFSGKVVAVPGDLPSSGIVQVFKPADLSPLLQNSFGIESQQADTFSFSSPVSFTIQNTDVGSMHLVFSITTASGQVSNSVQEALLIKRAVNHPPVLGTITMPDTVVLPANDSILIKIKAALSDPDGQGDISQVFFYSLNSTAPDVPIYLLDDGGLTTNPTSGDDVAGDGTYTVTVKLVDSPFVRSVGTFHFEFHAIDKENASATPVVRSITIR